MTADQAPRCWRCDRKLGEELTRPWHVTCSRCKAINKAPLSEIEGSVVESEVLTMGTLIDPTEINSADGGSEDAGA